MEEEPSGVERFWEITRPTDPQLAALYLDSFETSLSIPKPIRFAATFQRPKKNGGMRTITPAAEPLKTTQFFLADWIRDNLPQGQDYCYTGRQVNTALNQHRQSSYALVCDLKDAFDQVTEAKIKNWFPLYDKRLKGEVMDIMADLITFYGRAPQGCRTTAFAYNVVVSEMDQHLGVVASDFGIDAWTRYSDNICFSSQDQFDKKALEEQVKRIARGFGFELSWAKPFDRKIEYLGAEIENGKISIPDVKVGEFANRIFDWLEAEDPAKHYHQALGILTWARELSGPNVNQVLLDALDTYFRTIDKPNSVEKNMGSAYGELP